MDIHGPVPLDIHGHPWKSMVKINFIRLGKVEYQSSMLVIATHINSRIARAHTGKLEITTSNVNMCVQIYGDI